LGLVRWIALAASCGLVLLAASSAPAADGTPPLALADAAWARRADDPVAIRVTLDACAAALALDPDALGAHWRRLRALHFQGEYLSETDGEARQRFDGARAAAEAAFAALRRRTSRPEAVGGDDPEALAAAFEPASYPDVARIHFWSAIAWASWSRYQGTLTVLRAGVADKLRRQAEAVVALEPSLEHGGAHRLLAHLHATLPRVPFVTGWVDRGRALPEMARALRYGERFEGNRLLLALLLLDLAPERRGEALQLLAGLAQSEPTGEDRIEMLDLRETARERLREANAESVRRGSPAPGRS
jgi:hypothetical protein